MADDEQPKPVRYVYKPSVGGSPQMFESTGQGLSFQAGFRSAVWPYVDVAQVRLTYRPVSMLAHRFRADIRHKDGRKLTIVSATWAGIVALTPQNDGYRAFVEELHRRVAVLPNVVCLAGLRPVVFAIAAAVFAAVLIALAGLFVRALTTDQFVAALFMLGFAGWFSWHTGGWLKRNKPHRYSAGNVPRQLLP